MVKRIISIILVCALSVCFIGVPVYAFNDDYTEDDLLSKAGDCLIAWAGLFPVFGTLLNFCEVAVTTMDLFISCCDNSDGRLSEEECLYYWDGLAHELNIDDGFVFQDCWALWAEVYSTLDSIGYMQAETVALNLTVNDVCNYIYNADGSFKTLGNDVYLDDNNQVVISKDFLLAVANRLKNYYQPVLNSDTITISHKHPIYETFLNNVRKPLRFGSDLFACQDWQEVYLVGFSKDEGGGDYYSGYQIHVYHVWEDDGTLSLYGDFTFPFNESCNTTKLLLSNVQSYPYVTILPHYDDNKEDLTFNGFPSLPRFINLDYSDNVYNILVNDDSTFPIATWYNKVDFTPKSGESLRGWVTNNVEYDDFGFYASSKPIEMKWDNIIPYLEGLDDNAQITPTGNSIYDYSVTYGNTTTTIYNIYNGVDPDEPTTDEPTDTPTTGGGTVSGDINVSGDVNVGGTVDVNINVNQNSNNSGENVGQYIDIGTTEVDWDMDSYLEKVPEVSKGFTDYLKDFFTWLPPEIYGLLILALVVAIWCRIVGR